MTSTVYALVLCVHDHGHTEKCGLHYLSCIEQYDRIRFGCINQQRQALRKIKNPPSSLHQDGGSVVDKCRYAKRKSRIWLTGSPFYIISGHAIRSSLHGYSRI
jgi:hypothetical protein